MICQTTGCPSDTGIGQGTLVYRKRLPGLMPVMVLSWSTRDGCLMAMTAEFMVLLRRSRPPAPADATRGDNAAGIDRIAPAISLIACEFAEPLSVCRLARACSMSEPTLRRAFASAMGCTPREYWMSVRLQMATTMLRSTSESIAEISAVVGFTTLSSFKHVFRERFGATPPRMAPGHRLGGQTERNLDVKTQWLPPRRGRIAAREVAAVMESTVDSDRRCGERHR